MTIKELIEELTKYNEELEVLLEVKGADDVGVEPRIVLTHRKGGRSCVLLEILGRNADTRPATRVASV